MKFSANRRLRATSSLNWNSGRVPSPLLRIKALTRDKSVKWYSTLTYHLGDFVLILRKK